MSLCYIKNNFTESGIQSSLGQVGWFHPKPKQSLAPNEQGPSFRPRPGFNAIRCLQKTSRASSGYRGNKQGKGKLAVIYKMRAAYGKYRQAEETTWAFPTQSGSWTFRCRTQSRLNIQEGGFGLPRKCSWGLKQAVYILLRSVFQIKFGFSF